MFRRIGYFIIGAAAVIQAQAVLPGEGSFSEVLSAFIFNPVDFLTVSLLFLMSFLMFAPFFSNFLRLLVFAWRKKVKLNRKDALELIVFAVMFSILFYSGFWFPLLTSIFAFIYGWITIDLGVKDKEIRHSEGG
ncbi:MAG TPA: hypothetical protein VFT51_03160 [Bacillales bacterium]|nr:hypothetical protein [Bacillales bacterium]